MSLQKIYKTKKIIKVSPEETLSSALSLLSSSHDVAFVFAGDEFLGVVNPYHCLIMNAYPGNTKVKHALTHPPRLSVKDSVEEAVRAMMESKMHYLPVFEGHSFAGIITARRIIGLARESGKTDIALSKLLKNKKPLISLREKGTVAKSLSLFKREKVSKLIVLSDDLKLAGVVAYYDLFPIILVPKERLGSGSHVGNKKAQLSQPISTIMKTHVITIFSDRTLSHAAQLILDNEIGSVIVTDSQNHPLGIITTQDILATFAKPEKPGKVEFVHKNIVSEDLPGVYSFVEHLNSYFSKLKDVEKIKFNLKAKKNGGLFEARLIVAGRGGSRIIKYEEKNLHKLLQEVRDASKNLVLKK
jgi:predicted transcriptional regulator